MLIADMEYGQIFLFPSKRLTHEGKPELVYSIIDENAGVKRVLSTLYVEGYKSSVVHDGVFTRNNDGTKNTLFRYEVDLATLDEHFIDIPTDHLMGSPRPVFRITKEMNEQAIRLRARDFGGTDSEDDEYYSSRASAIRQHPAQLTMGTTSEYTTPFQRTIVPERPKKKTLYLVQTDITPYLS